MVVQQIPDAYTRQLDVLRRLLASKGLGSYALFFEIDADTLPDGSPELTGYALGSDGQAYWFVLGWDTDLGCPSLTTWKPVSTERGWWQAEEYLDARRALGLAAVAPAHP